MPVNLPYIDPMRLEHLPTYAFIKKSITIVVVNILVPAPPMFFLGFTKRMDPMFRRQM